jgi:hypothetical protein
MVKPYVLWDEDDAGRGRKHRAFVYWTRVAAKEVGNIPALWFRVLHT